MPLGQFIVQPVSACSSLALPSRCLSCRVYSLGPLPPFPMHVQQLELYIDNTMWGEEGSETMKSARSFFGVGVNHEICKIFFFLAIARCCQCVRAHTEYLCNARVFFCFHCRNDARRGKLPIHWGLTCPKIEGSKTRTRKK